MTDKAIQRKPKTSIQIIIAVISLVGVCVTTLGVIVVGIFPSLLTVFDSNPSETEAITFRVTEISGVSVPHAKVILLSGNDIHIQYTDSNGTSTFSLIKTETLRVFVETDQYEIYDQIFSIDEPSPIEIRLNPKDVSKKSVIIRVIDDKDDIPINGAEVILIVNGNIYSQVTDSSGITKFTTAFPTDEIDGDISVNISGFKAEHQRVTLQADRVQDVRLDKTSSTLTIGFTGEGEEVARTPEAGKDALHPDEKEENANSNTNVDNIFDCSSKSLSLEEIVNCGNREYQYTWDMADSLSCYFGDDVKHVEGNVLLSISFSNRGDKMKFVDLFNNDLHIYTKVSSNTYFEQSKISPSTTLNNQTTITFNAGGFELHHQAYGIETGELRCDYLGLYTVTK